MKRLILVLIAVWLGALLLSGCQTDAVPSDTSGGTESGTSAPGGDTEGDKLLPALQPTGKKVTYLTWDNADELADPTTGWYEINELMKQKYGCELEFVYSNYADLATKLVTSVLSKAAPDLVKYKSQDNPNNIYKDLVQSVDGLIDFDSELWKDVKEINDRYLVNGKHYAAVTKTYNGGVIFYNTAMFDENAVETPLDLYKKGEWTWSKLEEIAKQLTVDSDNDGIVDVYGWEGHPLYVYPTCGVDYVKVDDKGKFVNNMRDPVIAEAMNFILRTGFSGSDCRALSLNGENNFANKKTAIFWDERWRISTYAEQIKNGEIGIAPTPKMDGADQYYVSAGGEMTWIAKGAKNTQGALAYLNILRYMETDEATVARLKAKSKDAFGYTDDMMALFDEMDSDKFTLVFPRASSVGEWGNSAMWELWNEVGVYEVPWTSVLEKYYPILQSEIEAANSES